MVWTGNPNAGAQGEEQPAGPLELQDARWGSTPGGSVAEKMFNQVEHFHTWGASLFQTPGEWHCNLLG